MTESLSKKESRSDVCLNVGFQFPISDRPSTAGGHDAILSDAQLKRFHHLASEAGLAVLVEVHDESELARAIAVKASLIGVNNRDLKMFAVDLGTTERLAAKLQQARGPDTLLVAESGIYNHADVERLARYGAEAILVGESLMKHAGMAAKVRELLV